MLRAATVKVIPKYDVLYRPNGTFGGNPFNLTLQDLKVTQNLVRPINYSFDELKLVL